MRLVDPAREANATFERRFTAFAIATSFAVMAAGLLSGRLWETPGVDTYDLYRRIFLAWAPSRDRDYFLAELF